MGNPETSNLKPAQVILTDFPAKKKTKMKIAVFVLVSALIMAVNAALTEEEEMTVGEAGMYLRKFLESDEFALRKIDPCAACCQGKKRFGKICMLRIFWDFL